MSYSPAYCGWLYWDSKAQSIGGDSEWIESVIGWVHDPGIEYGTESVVLYEPSSGWAFMQDERTGSDGFTPPAPASGFVSNADTLGTAYLGVPEPALDDVLFYSSATETFDFARVGPPDATGHRDLDTFESTTGTRGWSHVITGDYNGDAADDVLFYRADGVARFYEVDASGTFRALGAPCYPTAGYAQIESAELVPSQAGVDLVWYLADRDLLVATRYIKDGVVNLWPGQSTSSFGDQLTIVTGFFTR